MKNISAKQYTARHLSKRTKKTVLSFGLLSVIGFVFFLAMPVSAEVDANVIKSGILRFLIQSNLYFAKMFVNLSIFELKFFITIAAYNDYINADVVKLGWQVIRDFANMFFIVEIVDNSLPGFTRIFVLISEKFFNTSSVWSLTFIICFLTH